MKILKIFGIVVGIHVFALILIFANPGCSSTTKPAPSPSETVAAAETAPGAAPMISVPPGGGGGGEQLAGTPVTPAGGYDLNTAAPTSEGTSGVRFSPTRPNTPAASAVLRGEVENVTPATTYTIKKGDSLWSVAHKFHVTTKDIATANSLRSGATIRPGQKLIIPSKAPAAPKAAAASAPATGTTTAARTASSPSTRPTAQEFKYKVKPGETLGGIAHKFGVSVGELAVQNNISDPMKLRAGTELTIPGWQPASGSSSGSKGTASHERRTRERTERASPPAATPTAPEPTATPSTPPPEQNQIPNLLEPSPAPPAPTESTPSTTVPVIDIGGQDNSTPSSTSTPSQ